MTKKKIVKNNESFEIVLFESGIISLKIIDKKQPFTASFLVDDIRNIVLQDDQVDIVCMSDGKPFETLEIVFTDKKKREKFYEDFVDWWALSREISLGITEPIEQQSCCSITSSRA